MAVGARRPVRRGARAAGSGAGRGRGGGEGAVHGARARHSAGGVPHAPGVHSAGVTLDTTKADDIALVIEEAIVSGELAPGTVLRQEQLSEQFNVSRTPIREALRRLAALGLVSFVPNRGVRVRTLSRDELREAFLVRAELESLATELAVPRMTEEDLAALDAAEKRFGELTVELRTKARKGIEDASLAVEWMASNYAFHDVIYAAA